MASLGVNIDHVATIRQARRTVEPDPVWAAALAELGGADAITVHLREDRRHIQDRDLEVLRRTVQVKLNLEGSIDAEMVAIACRVRPDQVTLVPERREEVTTEGGLDLLSRRQAVATAVGRLRDAGIPVSLFIDPTPAAIDAARVEALRQRCRQLGGWLTVLRQPTGAELPAWLDAPSRSLIEAVKRRFDPLEQLAPGRLPGVAAGLPPRAARPV